MRMNRTQLEHRNTAHDRSSSNDGGGGGRGGGGGSVGTITTDGKVTKHAVHTTGYRIGRRIMRIASNTRNYSSTDEKPPKQMTNKTVSTCKQTIAETDIKQEIEEETLVPSGITNNDTTGVGGSCGPAANDTKPTTAERVDRLLCGVLCTGGGGGNHHDNPNNATDGTPDTEVAAIGARQQQRQPSAPSNWPESSHSIASVIQFDNGDSCGSGAMSLSSDDQDSKPPSNEEGTNCAALVQLQQNDNSSRVGDGSFGATAKYELFDSQDSKPDLTGIEYSGSFDVNSVSFADYHRLLILEAATKMVNEQQHQHQQPEQMQCVLSAQTKPKHSVEQQLRELCKQSAAPLPSSSSHSSLLAKDSDGEERKIFIGGLTFDTSEYDIEKYFSQFGMVDGVNHKYDSETGISRCFGFVSFAEEEVVDAVLRKPVHIINGRYVEARRAKARPIYKKIFVGGIDSSITEDDIRDYFWRFGKVQSIDIPLDRTRNTRRHFCFVYFQSEEAANEAAMWPRQLIKNKLVDVRKTVPSTVSENQRRLAVAAGLDLSEFDPKYKISKMNATARMVQASAALAAASLATPLPFLQQSPDGIPALSGPRLSLTPKGAIIPFTDHIASAQMAALAVASRPNAYPAATNFSENFCTAAYGYMASMAPQQSAPPLPMAYAPNNYSYLTSPTVPTPASYSQYCMPTAYHPQMYPTMVTPPTYHMFPMASPTPATTPHPTAATPTSSTTDPQTAAAALAAYAMNNYGVNVTSSQASTPCQPQTPDYNGYYANSNSTAYYASLAIAAAPPPPPPPTPPLSSVSPSPATATSESETITGSSIIPDNETAAAAAAAITSTISGAAYPYDNGK